MPGEAATSNYFGCSACGKCCNSAPRLLLPELFHHRSRFFGLLGVTRQTHGFALFVHGFCFAADARCPALQADGACSVHEQRKPSECQLVPLDGERPDDEQALVLSLRRKEASFWGAECLRETPAPGFRELTRQLRVIDPESDAALAAHRVKLDAEQRFWREATLQLLGSELGSLRLPVGGALSMSLVPALSRLAAVSPRCRQLVTDFVRAQNQLADELIESALLRKRREDRADTALLRRLRETGKSFEAALVAAPPRAGAHAPSFVTELENWLVS